MIDGELIDSSCNVLAVGFDLGDATIVFYLRCRSPSDLQRR
jgi:hypothetical protein